MNHIVIKGRIARTPELKTTQSGVSVCSFSVAVDRRFKQNGEKVTDFFDCVAWRSAGEFVAKYFEKGQEILLSGEMQSRQYEAKDGSNRRVWEIIVENTEFCGSKQNNSDSSNAEPPKHEAKQGGFTPVDIEPDDLPW